MRIAVAGSSGAVGRHVVAGITARGHEVVELSRGIGTDLTSPRGGSRLASRLAGVDAVIDCIGPTTTKEDVAIDFFTTTTRHLLEAESDAHVAHHLTLSIVGVDRIPHGYYAGKLAQESAVRASTRPASILRATQFHEFAEQMLARGRFGPILVAPKMRSQPIAATEVAAALVELAEGAPQAATLELAGPETLEMSDMVRAVAKSERVRALIVPMTLPGPAGKPMRDGALTSSSPWRTGRQTFASWLSAR